MAELVLIGIGFTIANLIILGLNVKLYTEYFKHRARQADVDIAAQKNHDG